MKSFLRLAAAAAFCLAFRVQAAFPDISLSMPSTVNTNEPFTVTITSTDSDGDLNTMGLRWQGFGLQNTWTISGYSDSRTQNLTAPSSPTTMNLRGEVWDNAENGTTGSWLPVTVLQNYAPTASLTGPTTRTVGQSGTWNFSVSDTPNGNLKQWRFYFSTNPNPQWTQISGSSASGSYTNSFGSVGTYTMIVEVQDRSGASASTSLTVNVTPAPPVITSATSASGTYGSSFSYSITATNSPTSYSASGLPGGLSVNTGNGVISGAPSATGTYSVGLGATNTGGTGSATLSLTINKANQTISFGALANKLTNDPPFGISASASSGLGVSFSVLSGPATISGSTITLTGSSGTVTIRASQGGNANYNAASTVDQSFTVSAPGTQSDTGNQNQLNIHIPTP